MRRLLLYLVLALAACAPTVIATKALTPTNSQPTASPKSSATTPPAGGALGNQLGAAALGDSEAQVIAKLGRPSRETITHGIGSPRWEYDSGYVIEFSGTDRRVWLILVQPPAVAATAEGFALRDTDDAFRSVYAAFHVQEFLLSGDLQLQVATSDETLVAGFGVDHSSRFVVINGRP
jgi:hypothetical protein